MPTLSERQHLLLNAGIFQVAWLISVLGGNWIALLTTAAVTLIHLVLVRQRWREVVFLSKTLIIGFVCDLILIQSGVLLTGSQLPPPWLTCLWLLFGTTVGYALRMFHGRAVIAAAAGGALAPLSYVGGAKLAGVPLLEPLWMAWLVIALVWTCVFPGLIYLYLQNRISERIQT